MKDSNNRFRVVLDTNQVIGAGTAWLVQGRPTPDNNLCRALLVCVAERHHGLYCEGIVEEYLEKLIERNHSPLRIAKFITYLIGAFASVSVTSAAAPVRPSDPDDEIFLLCALDGQAHYLVSDDRSLLDIKKDYACPVICGGKDAVAHLGA